MARHVRNEVSKGHVVLTSPAAPQHTRLVRRKESPQVAPGPAPEPAPDVEAAPVVEVAPNIEESPVVGVGSFDNELKEPVVTNEVGNAGVVTDDVADKPDEDAPAPKKTRSRKKSSGKAKKTSKPAKPAGSDESA